MQILNDRWVRAVSFLTCCLCLLAGGISEGQTGGKEGPKTMIPEMLKERLDTLAKIYDLTVKAQKSGKAMPGAVHQTKMALLHAQLDFAASKPERVKLLQEILKEVESWEKVVQKMVTEGKATEVEALQVHISVLEARISLEITQQEKAPPGPTGGK